MVLDEAGRQSDEATTPAFREWAPGATFEDEMEFANCPHAKIQGFRIVFYPYQVWRRETPCGEKYEWRMHAGSSMGDSA
jgi:hypothetical protein